MQPESSVSNVPSASHVVRFFEEYAYPAGYIAGYLHAALADGRAGIVFAASRHLDQIVHALGLLGTDVAAKSERGQLVMRDAEEIARRIVVESKLRESVFHEIVTIVRGALEQHGSVHAYGEIVDVLARSGDITNAVQLESWWNQALRGGGAIELLCGYSLHSFADADAVEGFDEVCSEHARVKPVGRDNGGDSGRALAELEQRTAALENEASRCRLLELERKSLEEAERAAQCRAAAATEHLIGLQRFTSVLSGAKTATQVGEVVVDELGRAFDDNALVLVAAVDDTEQLRMLAQTNAPASELERYGTVWVDSASPFVETLRTMSPIWLKSRDAIVQHHPAIAREVPDASGVGCVPLVIGGQKLGVMGIVHRAPRDIPAWEPGLLEAYAKQVALAVSRAQSNEAARRATSRLQLLADAATRIAEAKLDLRQVIDNLLTEVTRAGFADFCSIQLVSEDEEAGAAVGTGAAGQSAANQTGDAGAAQEPSELVLALRASGEVIGTLTALRRARRGFTREDQKLLRDLADRVALSIENALLYERAQRERERAEQERQRAESANRAKDEFLAMLGHELRNPLSPMLTAVQLMQLRAGGALQMERTIIERQLNHMVRLVNDLLDVSRIARGKVEIQTAPVELATVVADAIELASPLLEEQAHNLVVAVPASGLVVDADPTRLSQVVANLLSNAAKYTPANGLITITSEVCDGRVRLSVRDTGAGIEPDFLPRIFDLFVQGGQASDRAQGGLGLGLAIARNLVDMHGGTLRAESEGLGKGSTFTVELALAKNNQGAASLRSNVALENGSSRKVLIVDDNVDAAEVLAEALKAVGHNVRVAHDGPSALPVAEQFWPEVALLDVGLPVMDGYELGRRLRSLVGSELRIVAVTGYGTSAYRHRSREEGFDEHLVKPIELGQLQSLIRNLFA